MLIASRDTLTDAARNNVSPALWASLSPLPSWRIKLTITNASHHVPLVRVQIFHCLQNGAFSSGPKLWTLSLLPAVPLLPALATAEQYLVLITSLPQELED